VFFGGAILRSIFQVTTENTIQDAVETELRAAAYQDPRAALQIDAAAAPGCSTLTLARNLERVRLQQLGVGREGDGLRQHRGFVVNPPLTIHG